ncbi:MAG: homoserine dehydrogenase [Deltaproteobacteria bacterium]|jgi:homoserine dehydrogenase|nr:homoserine dehydrogenase [Deltaproteobacteria bacterium]
MLTTVGLLGYGNVGAGVAKLIKTEGGLLSDKLGWPLRLAKCLVRDVTALRNFDFDAELLTTDPSQVVGNPEIQVVCELMGGLEPARTYILRALEAGQHVVTANKALLATHGLEIFKKAAEVNRDVMFEAAVAGAIPVIRTLKEGLTANRIQSLYGILNGTTNHIMTRMSKDALTFNQALAEAQQAGYAEADPTTDVEGLDAAHKLLLLSALAYGVLPKLNEIHIEGITKLDPIDFSFAAEFGYVIKLLAVSCLRNGQGPLEVRLHPTMLPADHLLAGVNGVLNAIMIRGHASGDIFLSGPGAGMMPTASSVVGDIIEVARSHQSIESSLRPPILGWRNLKSEAVMPMSEALLGYYLRLTVLDRPGVLSSISGVMGHYNISIAQVIQRGQNHQSGWVDLVLLTHKALESDLQKALKVTQDLETVRQVRLIRVEEFLP